MILRPTSISSSVSMLFFFSIQLSWRQIHEHPEKIYYQRHWRYQYFSYNKSGPNSLNCERYPIMIKKKSIKTQQWMMAPTNSSLVLCRHFWMTFCWQKGMREMLSSGVNSAAQMLADYKFLLSVHVPTPNTRHIGGNTLRGSSFCFFPPSGSIYPSVCHSIQNGVIQVDSLKHTHTHKQTRYALLSCFLWTKGQTLMSIKQQKE